MLDWLCAVGRKVAVISMSMGNHIPLFLANTLALSISYRLWIDQDKYILLRMTTKNIIVSSVTAIVLAVLGFEIAIYIDGVLSGYLHHSAELVFGANIFVNENSTLSISLLSSAIAHTIAVLLVVYTALWMVHVDKILFISSYSIATVAYLSYKAGFFVGIDSGLILFIGVRLIFHVMWVPVWFYLFGRKSQKQ